MSLIPPSLRRPLLLGLLAVTYVALGRLSLLLAFVNESASAVWPPTGLAIAALLLLGLRAWPAIAVGAFLVNLTTSGVVWSSIVIAIGNTLEGVAGAWLAARFARGRAAFDSTSDVLRFVLIAAGASTIAASIGAASLFAAGLAPAGNAPAIWFTWWLGDTAGAVVVTPLIILWSRRSALVRPTPRTFEALALGATVVVVSIIVFGASPAGQANYPIAFLVIPTLLWAAFRLGARETATVSAVIVIIAVDGTLRGYGPFVRSSPNDSFLLLQAFIGVTTTMMLCVAAQVAARRAIEAELRSVNAGLGGLVTARTEELVQANARLLEAQQVAHVGSWEWDIGSNRVWWSDELYRIYGIVPDAPMTYEAFLARVHSDDRAFVDARVRRAMESAEPFAFEHRITRPQGSIRVLHAAGRVIVDSEGRPTRMIGIGHDITDRKLAEEERAQLIQEQSARQEAEETSRAKDEFLAILSHELRTPLNVALGWAHTLRELPVGDTRIPRAVDAIHRNLLLQTRLVSDILDASRIARGALVLERTPIDLGTVIQAAIEMVREAALSRRIQIEETLSLPLALEGDGKRLQQVVWNVLSNAVRFGREGGCVRIQGGSSEETVTITIEDDGPGIDPAFLPYMFEPFRQADASPARRHDGLGLGLSIAQHIVELHGGTISATNAASGGAAVIIQLPTRSAMLT